MTSTDAPSLFAGPEYDPARDNDRLASQIARVFHVMSDRRWRTLAEAAAATTALRSAGRDPEASISAQLRHLRKPKWGAHTVERRGRHGSDSLFEYRLLPAEETLCFYPEADEERSPLYDELAELRQWQADACEVVRHVRGLNAWTWGHMTGTPIDDRLLDLLRRAENP